MTSPDEASLEDLLRLSGKGDRAAFTRLYECSSAKLFGVICRIYPQQDGARDALQECYIRIWQNSGRYDPARGSAIAWMAQIARHMAIDMRRRKSEKILAGAVQYDEESDGMTSDRLTLIETNQSMNRLEECLGDLPEPSDQMVMLAYYHGWSREELSHRFKRPVATVKTILRRALIALRRCLDE